MKKPTDHSEEGGEQTDEKAPPGPTGARVVGTMWDAADAGCWRRRRPAWPSRRKRRGKEMSFGRGQRNAL